MGLNKITEKEAETFPQLAAPAGTAGLTVPSGLCSMSQSLSSFLSRFLKGLVEAKIFAKKLMSISLRGIIFLRSGNACKCMVMLHSLTLSESSINAKEIAVKK